MCEPIDLVEIKRTTHDVAEDHSASDQDEENHYSDNLDLEEVKGRLYMYCIVDKSQNKSVGNSSEPLVTYGN